MRNEISLNGHGLGNKMAGRGMQALPAEIERWQAVVDRTSQNQFVYAVLTTGVVCRTGCPSRRPRPENVRYFAKIGDAVQAGFRPCKRCIKEDSFQQVAAICRDIDDETEVSLAALAARHTLSQRQMQRLFRTVLEITPKQYETQLRFSRFLQHLRNGLSVTEAVYAAGFKSSRSMYEPLHHRAGMTVKQYRAGGLGELVFYATCSTVLGEVVLAQTLKGLCFAGFFDDQAQGLRELQSQLPQAEVIAVGAQQLEPIASAFARAVNGDYQQLRKLPLDIQGTIFQSQVWEAVRQVPVGMQVTYQELATSMKKPRHARAVARALAGNHIALAVPCHRVVPAGNKSTGGYRWGATRKTKLLNNER